MRVHLNETCYVCNKVFCCATCLTKHFKKKHQKQLKRGTTTRTKGSKECPAICPLCEYTPLILPEILDTNLLKHIEKQHLPLNCKKCSKIYTTIAELKEFSKCNILLYDSDKENRPESHQNIISNMTHKTTIATQTSPMYNGNYNDKTPISLIEQCWKSKIKEDYISDSVSSIKNLSTLSNGSMRRSIGVISATTTSSKGKLVRTTSTPVNAELLMIKPKERTFDASSGQVSSICHSDCDSLADKASAMQRANFTFSPKPRKIVSRAKVTAVTPLRHVMSKSIQKAFAEHGVMHAVRGPTGDKQRLLHFVDEDASLGVTSPLDLRLSPALRRLKSSPIIKSKCNNDFVNTETSANEEKDVEEEEGEEVMVSSEKVSRESIFITRTEHIQSRKSINGNHPFLVVTSTTDNNMPENTTSVYTTCQSVEIIRSSKMSSYKNLNKATNGMVQVFHNKYDIMTPTCREPETTKIKKLINFETPKRSSVPDEILQEDQHLQPSLKMEEFYTPESTPIADKSSPQNSLKQRVAGDRKKWTVRRQLTGHFSPLKRPPLRRTVSYHQNYVNKKPANKTTNSGESKKQDKTEGWSLGTLMNSVKNFLSFDRDKTGKTLNEPLSNRKGTFSFADQLAATNAFDMKTTLKRKRSNSIKDRSPNCKTTAICSPENASFKKKYRVQPRRPIHS